MSSTDEDLMVLLLLNNNNNNNDFQKRKRKYWVHPYLKNAESLGTFSVAKESMTYVTRK